MIETHRADYDQAKLDHYLIVAIVRFGMKLWITFGYRDCSCFRVAWIIFDIVSLTMGNCN